MGEKSILKVLLADTSKNILKISEQKQKTHHLKIIKPSNRDELIRFISKKDFDLVVIHPDHKLFQIDEVIPLITKNKLPFIAILNSFKDKTIIDFLYDHGVLEIIPFSISDEQLVTRLKIVNTQNRNKEQIKELKKNKNDLKSELGKKTTIHEKLRKELSNEIAGHVSSIVDHEKVNRLLSNRNRELNCLISISELNRAEQKLESFLEKIVDLIPTAFQYPNLTAVEILYDGKQFNSKTKINAAINITEEINYNSISYGRIAVVLDKENPSLNQKSFIDEKRQLLRTIANNLSHNIHRKQTDIRLNIFLKAIDQSPLMVSISNAKTKIFEYINPKFSTVTGFTIADLNSVNPYRTSTSATLKPVIEEMRNTVLRGKTWSGTYQNYKKGGEKFWQRTSLYPLLEDGEVSHVLSIGEDISKQIEFEEELKVSKENYEHITQNAPGGIFIVSNKGNILYANKKASEISGYLNAEIINSSIQKIVHPDDVKEIYEKLDLRLKGQTTINNYKARIVTKEGKVKTLEVSGTKTKWKGVLVDLIVVYDITVKTRLANLLKIQNKIDYMSTIPMGLEQSFEEIFKTLFQFNWVDGGGIYLMNKDMDTLNLVYSMGVSATFKKETGQYLSNSKQFAIVQQKKSVYMKLMELKGLPQIVTDEGFKSLLVIPLIHDNKAIGVFNLASKLRTELSENEQLIFEAIANRIAQMITLIFTQEELQQKNQKLQETLKEIQEKQHLLIQKSKLESLGEMAAGVAHEINQPLGIISLSLENMLYKVSSKKASEDYLTEKFNSIFANINKIEEIINHIRTFSRDQKSIIIERVDVNKVVKEAYSLISEQYIFHDISVILNLDDKIGFTLGNRHKLEQVLFNLFSNAKFALVKRDDELVELPLEKKIVVQTYINNNTIHLDVEDNGVGIEEHKLEKVFNPFFTTKPEGVGTGLGLSIVYGIIAEMKGTINIESKENEFTKVKIELPHNSPAIN